LVVTLIGIYALEFSIRALFPHYDPSGHVGFVNTPEGVVLAKNRWLLRQIKNAGDYNVAVTINDLGLRESKNIASAKLGIFLP